MPLTLADHQRLELLGAIAGFTQIGSKREDPQSHHLGNILGPLMHPQQDSIIGGKHRALISNDIHHVHRCTELGPGFILHRECVNVNMCYII